ncbi:MAG: lytic transglycosylase domain-containing protein [Paracoccaceae bacterium]|nr:lytic transglycosylase domain-containing protein [Paracoccaceae bacterium]
MILLFLSSAPSVAQEIGNSRDFTFKRIAVPSAGSAPKISVQIDPNEEQYWITPPSAPNPRHSEPTEPAPLDAVPVSPDDLPYNWFWQVVPPGLGFSPANRFQMALARIAAPPPGESVPSPRLEHLQNIADEHGVEILKATIGTKISPALVLAVIGVESSGQSDAVSHAGATGLMQLMPATAERFGVLDREDAAENIAGGVAYLDWLMEEFGADPLLSLAGYNAGENAVKANDGVPPFGETRAYVPKVLAAWKVARNLCMTPPELMTDGCVFARREVRVNE